MTRDELVIERGARHCKILDNTGACVFRTTNLRDAEIFLGLIEEKERLEKLLLSRGMAPHRIYLLPVDENERNHRPTENSVVYEVVIIAKAEDGVVVRHLDSGREEIIDLEEIHPIDGGSYLQASDALEKKVHVVVKVDAENGSANIAVFSEANTAKRALGGWVEGADGLEGEFSADLVHADGEVKYFRVETVMGK